LQDQIVHPIKWRLNLLTYGLWVVGALLVWLVSYGTEYYLSYFIPSSMDGLLAWITGPILQAVIAWLILQIVISDRYLPWLIAITLLGYFVGSFLARFIYPFADLFFHLIPGNTVREMFLGSIIVTAVTLATTATFQVGFMGLVLKRISLFFAVTWIVAALLAGIIASLFAVMFELKFYSPSAMFPDLIQDIITGIISGVPLIWLRTREVVKK
jgi:hypothetical protein